MDPSALDLSRMHPARRYNYWLGGKDNFAVDREAGDRAAQAFPGVVTTIQQNRLFLRRAVEFVVAELGITQLLDIGTGLPTAGNTHEVAQRIRPQARIVYVDNDPLVLSHARALMTTSSDVGAIDYIDADLRHPEQILADPTLSAALDLSRPVALVLVAVLHFVPGDDAYRVVRTLLEPLAPGSCLVLSHACTGGIDASERARLEESKSVDDVTNRSRQQIAGLFAGTDLADPGLTLVSRWRPEPGADIPSDDQVAGYGGVGIKRRRPGPRPRSADLPKLSSP